MNRQTHNINCQDVWQRFIRDRLENSFNNRLPLPRITDQFKICFREYLSYAYTNQHIKLFNENGVYNPGLLNLGVYLVLDEHFRKNIGIQILRDILKENRGFWLLFDERHGDGNGEIAPEGDSFEDRWKQFLNDMHYLRSGQTESFDWGNEFDITKTEWNEEQQRVMRLNPFFLESNAVRGREEAINGIREEAINEIRDGVEGMSVNTPTSSPTPPHFYGGIKKSNRKSNRKQSKKQNKKNRKSTKKQSKKQNRKQNRKSKKSKSQKKQSKSRK